MSKMRMYFYILGTKPYYKEVSSVEEAKTMIDAIADFINEKVEERVFPDHCSIAGLEEYDEEEKEWMTWYDENGLDFNEHFNFSAESEARHDWHDVPADEMTLEQARQAVKDLRKKLTEVIQDGDSN